MSTDMDAWDDPTTTCPIHRIRYVATEWGCPKCEEGEPAMSTERETAVGLGPYRDCICTTVRNPSRDGFAHREPNPRCPLHGAPPQPRSTEGAGADRIYDTFMPVIRGNLTSPPVPQEREGLVGRLRLGEDGPWPVHEVLRALGDAADILLHRFNYDGHGWERLSEARRYAREYLTALASPAEASEPRDPADSLYVCRQCGCRGGCSAYCGAQDMEIRPRAERAEPAGAEVRDEDPMATAIRVLEDHDLYEEAERLRALSGEPARREV